MSPHCNEKPLASLDLVYLQWIIFTTGLGLPTDAFEKIERRGSGSWRLLLVDLDQRSSMLPYDPPRVRGLTHSYPTTIQRCS